jgi:hypothetical protein
MRKVLFLAFLFISSYSVFADNEKGSGTIGAAVNASPGPNFTLNPNPVNGSYFFINLGFKETEFPEAKVTITSVLGQVIYTAPVRKTEFAAGSIRIELADARLDRGMYFVQLSSGESTKTLKLAVR